ncbi:MAG: isoaspartyl peptidase/L-asparaginase family protein, partial [Verrucomicrobiota bacterium]|nr:isoaspartyl peptidase/L-asparaginase family protein [Verrucomicrobiota bacterium]
PPDKIEAHNAGCTRAADVGAKILEGGGTALDAVEAAVRVLEDDPTFNAGFGSAINSEGAVEMDAAIMEGSKLQVGAIASVRGVRHPISVARQVMAKTRHVLLVAEGARRFAEESGCELCEPEEMIDKEVRADWERELALHGSDTVGCVALDVFGNFAAGTSTGGLMHKMPGRVGDSPLVGHGLYADNNGGAVSTTGDGEMIMRLALAHRIVNAMCNGEEADRAAEEAIAVMARRVGGEAGCIVLDRQGRVGVAHNADHLAYAFRTSEMPSTIASVQKQR